MDKLTYDKYRRWRISFFNSTDSKTMRFGQAFVNTFFPSVGEPIAHLFYETDAEKAEEIILRDYVEM